MILEVYVNDIFYREEISPDMSLLDFLRDELGYLGTKKGCERGECGACSVILNGNLLNSCMVLLAQLPENSHIITIESTNPITTQIKESFIEYGAIQCGACTPGMIMASTSLLMNNPNPSSEEIKVGLSGVLCRCGCYPKILNAVESVRDQFGGVSDV